jgi:ABC-type transporter Mla subunit MlaD
MENLEILTLEYIFEYSKRKENALAIIKESLDSLKTNVEQIHNKEVEFYNLFYQAKKIQMQLKRFLGKSNAESLKTIDQKLDDIWSEYNKKVAEIENETRDLIFSKDKLEDYRAHVTAFLSVKIDNLNRINKEQNVVFENSVEDIKGKLDSLKRLLQSLSRKTEEIKTLKDFMTKIENEMGQVKVPSCLDDLLQISEEQINDLYSKTREIIDTLREEVKRFIIKNRLLSENEILTLELLYKMPPEELDFVVVATKLKETLKVSEEKLQSILFELSKKGFIVLKIIP